MLKFSTEVIDTCDYLYFIRLMVKAYRLMVKVYGLMVKAYRLMVKAYRLMVKAYGLMVKAYLESLYEKKSCVQLLKKKFQFLLVENDHLVMTSNHNQVRVKFYV